MEQVKWTCQTCGFENLVEYATDKRYLRCDACGQAYRVTGLHVDGKPIVHGITDTGDKIK